MCLNLGRGTYPPPHRNLHEPPDVNQHGLTGVVVLEVYTPTNCNKSIYYLSMHFVESAGI